MNDNELKVLDEFFRFYYSSKCTSKDIQDAKAEFINFKAEPQISDSVIEAIDSLQYKSGAIRIFDNAAKYFCETKREWIEARLEEGATIFSVSNGKDVFTVGETEGVDGLKITHFDIVGRNLFANFDNGGCDSIWNLRKVVSKPILKTEDGKELGLKEIAWTVNKFTFAKMQRRVTEENVNQKHCYWFSTEQAASEYIGRHQKKYSLQDQIDLAEWINNADWTINIASGKWIQCSGTIDSEMLTTQQLIEKFNALQNK